MSQTQAQIGSIMSNDKLRGEQVASAFNTLMASAKSQMILLDTMSTLDLSGYNPIEIKNKPGGNKGDTSIVADADNAAAPDPLPLADYSGVNLELLRGGLSGLYY